MAEKENDKKSGATAKAKKKAPSKKAAKKTSKKKKGGFFGSKEAKRLYWFLGAPFVLLMVWYAYTVAFVLDKETMTALENQLKTQAASLAQRALKEGFKVEEVDRCTKMTNDYTSPKGWYYSDEDIYGLVGLPRSATEKELGERCTYFAKAVAEMEKISHHIRHVFVCGESFLDTNGNGKNYIKAAANGKGVIQTVSRSYRSQINIPVNTSIILQQWQIYNVPGDCVIIGLSKTSQFRMSGKVIRGK